LLCHQGRIDHRDELDVLGHREQVESPQRPELPTCVQQHPEVTCEGGGIARDVHEPPGARLQRGERGHDRSTGAFARGVEHHEVGGSEPVGHDARRNRGLSHLDMSLIGGVPRCVGTRPAVPLHSEHGSGRPDDLSHERGEQTGTGVEISDAISRHRFQPVQHRPGERVGGAGMHLPEHPRAHFKVPVQDLKRQPLGLADDSPVDDQTGVEGWQPGVPPASGSERYDALAARVRCEHLEIGGLRPLESLDAELLDRRGGDEAAVQQLKIVGAVLVEPDATGVVDREANPAPPAEPIGGSGHFLNLDDAIDTGEPSKLLGDEVSLQASLSRQRDVLPVAAPASAGTGVRAGGQNAFRRRADDLDRIGAEVRLRLLSDSGPHALAGQRMADEDDAPVVGSRDAAASGRDRSRLDLDHVRLAPASAIRLGTSLIS
jgi:hypothetical protein